MNIAEVEEVRKELINEYQVSLHPGDPMLMVVHASKKLNQQTLELQTKSKQVVDAMAGYMKLLKQNLDIYGKQLQEQNNVREELIASAKIIKLRESEFIKNSNIIMSKIEAANANMTKLRVAIIRGCVMVSAAILLATLLCVAFFWWMR